MIASVRRRRPAVVSCLLVCLATGAGCPSAGGVYQTQEREPGAADRGETQGRMFDLVSNQPEGGDWQIRIRGASLWASFADGPDVQDLGTTTLDEKDTRRVWDLIDRLELEDRTRGKKDEDEGYFHLRLREPDGDAGHDIIHVYVSRATEDEDVLALTAMLSRMISKAHPAYRKEPPAF